MFAVRDKEWTGVSKFIEEAGEALQIAGKLLETHGAISHWDDKGNLRTRFLRELADVYASITFLMLFADPEERIAFSGRVENKIKNYRRWHTEPREQSEARREQGYSDVPPEMRDK